MAFVALIPIEFCTTTNNIVESKFFDCFEIVKKNSDKTLYTIKKDLLVREYKPFLAEFYGLLCKVLDMPPDLSKVRYVDTYEEFSKTFHKDEWFNNDPCLAKFGDETGLWPWSNTSPKIEISQGWMFYWVGGTISCEGDVGGDIIGMLELLLTENLSNPLASALRFVIIS